MQIVLCDEDAFMREVVEALVTNAGHRVVGVADTTVAAVGLIEAARPDVAIIDVALGYNTDFDMIASALAVGSRPIVFSAQVDADDLERYSPRPTFIPKPDLDALERALVTSEVRATGTVDHDRRVRPARAAWGPAPTGVGDAQAFFEAINAALPGDGLVSIDVEHGAEAAATMLTGLARGGDRVLAFPTAVRVFLPGSGDEGIASFLDRVVEAGAVPPGSPTASLVVREGELGADAFARLKRGSATAAP